MATMMKPGVICTLNSHLKDFPLVDSSSIRPNLREFGFSHRNVNLKHVRNASFLPVIRAQSSPGMAASEGEAAKEEEYVYRISTAEEWQELQSSGSIFGGELDKTSGFIHLSHLNQVQSILQNFFLNTKVDLYLLQIDAKKLGDGLVYEVVDGSNSFPHFYGPSRSFSPLSLDVVTKAEKLSLTGDRFTCSILE